MSAAVCGTKRSFFEEIPPSPTSSSSPPLSKRIRCSSSTSPTRFSTSSYLDHLRALFPHLEIQLLERALQECGNDLDAAIKSLHGLCFGAQAENPTSVEEARNEEKGKWEKDGGGLVLESASNNLPADGAEWVDLFVMEMMSATSIDDARVRAARMLEALEKSSSEHASTDTAQNLGKENMMLKEQIELLIRENSILKRAVSIQHERQKEFEDKNRVLEHLKQLISQYQEQMRTLEVNNYALTMHLKQAQQGSSFPGRFNPDVF